MEELSADREHQVNGESQSTDLHLMNGATRKHDSSLAAATASSSEYTDDQSAHKSDVLVSCSQQENCLCPDCDAIESIQGQSQMLLKPYASMKPYSSRKAGLLASLPLQSQSRLRAPTRPKRLQPLPLPRCSNSSPRNPTCAATSGSTLQKFSLSTQTQLQSDDISLRLKALEDAVHSQMVAAAKAEDKLFSVLQTILLAVSKSSVDSSGMPCNLV
jgi:hypothetical protein